MQNLSSELLDPLNPGSSDIIDDLVGRPGGCDIVRRPDLFIQSEGLASSQGAWPETDPTGGNVGQTGREPALPRAQLDRQPKCAWPGYLTH